MNLNILLQSKLRASILDTFTAAIILLIVSITLMLAFFMSSQIIATNSTLFKPTFQYVNTGLSVLASGGIIIWVVINLAAAIAAYYIRTLPILAFVSFLILGIELILSNTLVAVFETMVTQPQFISIGNNQLSLYVLIFKMLPLTVLVFGAIVIIFQFSKQPAQAGKSV